MPTEDWLDRGIPAKLAKDLTPVTRGFITDFSKDAWCASAVPTAHTIRHMVDTEKFCAWEGGNGTAMMLVNSFKGREWAVGDIDALLTLDANTAHQEEHDKPPKPRLQLFGVNQGYNSPHLKGDEVVRQLREHDVFVNTSLLSPIPAALLEAAAVGMPIVTRATCEIPKFFRHEENCLVFETYQDCLHEIDRLMLDRKLRKKLGAAARETILEFFNEEDYVATWNIVLKSAMERHNAVIAQ